MNPAWIPAIASVVGLAANAMWTVINVRMEARILARLDELKEWTDARYLRKPDVVAIAQRRPAGDAA